MTSIIPLDEKWTQVKQFYEKYYWHPEHSKLKFKFTKRPDDKMVDMLWNRMIEMQRTMKSYYFQNQKLADRLDYNRGHVEEIEKRGPDE